MSLHRGIDSKGAKRSRRLSSDSLPKTKACSFRYLRRPYAFRILIVRSRRALPPSATLVRLLKRLNMLRLTSRKDGEWKLTSVKEQESSVAYQHLKALQWLIGEWVDRDKSSTLDTVYQWTSNNSFITGSFTAYVQGKVDLQGTQVIGWDPVAKVIRSWVFDSQGGFGQGTWSKKGNSWVVDSSSILSTGEKASSINTYTYVDENTFTFQSEGRDIGGEPMPDIAPVTVIRKQPAAPRTGK